MIADMKNDSIPKSFLARRFHSLFGLFLAGFLFFHLFTNSQAGLLIGDDGKGFIHAVNGIHETPYLIFVELFILGAPLLFHALWGIKYLRTAEFNSFGGDGKHPYLPEYGRNRAYTWQRITSWILLVGVLLHVVQMRIVQSPESVQVGSERQYLLRVAHDPGLDTVAARLGVTVLDQGEVENRVSAFKKERQQLENPVLEQAYAEKKKFSEMLERMRPAESERIVTADNFGTVELLMLRDTFKNPIMILLYTIFVFAACFHAYNGLWTFCITWGMTISPRSQGMVLKASTFLMGIVAFFGLSAIYLTYWINLRQ